MIVTTIAIIHSQLNVKLKLIAVNNKIKGAVTFDRMSNGEKQKQ